MTAIRWLLIVSIRAMFLRKAKIDSEELATCQGQLRDLIRKINAAAEPLG